MLTKYWIVKVTGLWEKAVGECLTLADGSEKSVSRCPGMAPESAESSCCVFKVFSWDSESIVKHQ